MTERDQLEVEQPGELPATRVQLGSLAFGSLLVDLVVIVAALFFGRRVRTASSGEAVPPGDPATQ